jgi:chromosome segregation ATPase
MSEDILERAKRVEYPDSALRILPELIAEVEAKRNLALDMLTKNKDLLDRAMRAEAEVKRLRNLPRADVAAYDRRIQEMAARIKELEAEVEAKNKQIKELQDLIDKPPEEADWVADYHLLQSALDGPIIDAARKWHAAYRKAQNSNLMRAKEVKRLRSREADPQRMSQ